MTFHYLAFRAFCQATEDEGKVTSAIKFVSGSNDISVTRSTGYHGNPITILEAEIKSKKKIDSVFKSLGRDILEGLKETLESRLDPEGNFFFRIDKQAAFEGKMILSSLDDVIAIKGRVKAYPNNRENAIKALDDYLDNMISIAQ